MAGDSDEKLFRMAAGILCDAVEIYVRNNTERLQAIGYAVAALNAGSFGRFPATGTFPALTGSFAALSASFDAIGNDCEAGCVSPHPDVARLLDVLGRHHPDPGTAKDARRAARRAAKNRVPADRDRVPARASGR
jgi:hypothetical protein